MCHASTFLDLIEGLSFQVNPGDPSVDIDITWMEVRGSVRFLYLKLLSNLFRGRDRNGIYIPWASMLKFTSYADNVDVWVD